MEQFNLDIWLQDRSRKVVTRDGMPVRIVCWDSPNKEFPIVGFVERDLFTWADGKVIYGGECEDKNDLFFADEKELNSIIDELKFYLKNTPKEQVEKDWKKIQDWYAQHFTNEKHNDEDGLTEFEKEMQEYYFPELDDFELKRFAKGILDLARKELEKNYYTKVLDDRMVLKAELHSIDLQTAYDMGKQEALKDLPKWEKCDDNLPYSHIGGFKNMYLIKDGYCIKISDLENLLKVE